jgi:cold shock CspA family protein
MVQGTTKAQGVIRWFSNESDYGFVRPDDGGQDIHVCRQHTLSDGAESLKKGDRVTYDTADGKRNL